MPKAMRLRSLLALSLLLLLASLGALYAMTSRRLADAILARQEDELGRAEEKLSSCWNLPGFREHIALEEELMGVQLGDLREEDRWLKRANEQTVDGNRILEALAKGNLACFQWERAQDHADTALRRHPSDARALWLRGRALVEMQQEEQALQDFKKAYSLDLGSFAIRLSLADLMFRLGMSRNRSSTIRICIDSAQRMLASSWGFLDVAKTSRNTTKHEGSSINSLNPSLSALQP